MNLAYLMDDDYSIMITRRDSLPIDSSHHKRGYIIHFYKWVDSKVPFTWVEVEDHFIAFIQRLSKEYTVIECSNYEWLQHGISTTKYLVSLDSLLNGDTSDLPKERLIDRILIIVEEE